MNGSGQSARRPVTPLWIIALFISLAEGVLGVAVIQTDGIVQQILTAFVVGFPLLVASAFFLVLWNRPEVLYPPTEFGPGTDVWSFVQAMRQRSLDRSSFYQRIEDEIRGSVISEDIVKRLARSLTPEAAESAEEHITGVLGEAVEEAVEKIREENFLTIDSRPLLGEEKGRTWQVVYDADLTVEELLTEIWYSLDPQPPPYSYGQRWALRDRSTEKVFARIGTAWAGMKPDTRTLDRVEISAGMRLEAIPLPSDRP